MADSNEKQPSGRSIQDYLSIGYIYLLILGISRDVIYYWFLDVNILSYSNVLDVLLSPIIFLASKPEVVLGLIIFGVFIYFLNEKLTKKKLTESDSISDIEKTVLKKEATTGTLVLIALGFFGFFMGTGIGSGHRHGGKLENAEFEATHQITFLPKEEIQARLIGNNSGYIFYVLENGKQVKISPIQGNVKTIEKIP